MELNIFKKSNRFALIAWEDGLIEVDLVLPHLQYLDKNGTSGNWLKAGRSGKALRREGREFRRVLEFYYRSLRLMGVEGQPLSIYQPHEGWVLEVEKAYIRLSTKPERLAYYEKGKMDFGRELEDHIKLNHYRALGEGTEEYVQALKGYRTLLERVSLMVKNEGKH